MTKAYPNITIVDEHDSPVGAVQLPDAIKQGAVTRVVRVFVRNAAGELLLQKRSQFVYSPGLFCESAAGHVDEDEGYLEAAHRELEEEIGINAKLKQCAYYFHEEVLENFSIKRFNTIYEARSEGPFKINPEEVELVEFISLQELDHRILRSPLDFPEGFIYAYQQYKNSINKK